LASLDELVGESPRVGGLWRHSWIRQRRVADTSQSLGQTSRPSQRSAKIAPREETFAWPLFGTAPVLLDAAEQAGFEILLTTDKSIARQQHLHGRKLGLIALSNNHWPTLQIGAERILRALETASPGSHREVSLPRPRLHPSSRMPRRHDPS
jgi:hypothetical protein